MIEVTGKIDSITIPDPVPGVEPKLDDATVVFSLEFPDVGAGTIKCYPAAPGVAGLAVGPCRVMIDQG